MFNNLYYEVFCKWPNELFPNRNPHTNIVTTPYILNYSPFSTDPYVKVSLCFGDKTIKTKKSSVKRNTLEPIFNETLSFNVGSDLMDDCSLTVTVWDYNSKSRDDMMGRVVLGKQATGSQEKNHWVSMLSSQRSPVAQWHCLKPRLRGSNGEKSSTLAATEKRPLSSSSG